MSSIGPVPSGPRGDGHDDIETIAQELAADLARSAAARRLRPGADSRVVLDRLVGLAARLLGVSAGQLSILSDRQLVAAGHGLPPGSVGSEGELRDSLCTLTAALGGPLAIEDAHEDDRTRRLPPVRSGMVRAYLGVPLANGAGWVVGSLCAFDPAPRQWSEDDVATLELLARAVSTELEMAVLVEDHGSDRLRWSTALQAGRVGSFDWTPADGTIAWDATLSDLLGSPDAQPQLRPMQEFHDRVHPDDRGRVIAALQAAVDSCGRYDVEHRIMLPSGGVRWVHARAEAFCDATGAVSRVLGAVYDTTDVHESTARTSRVLEAMPSGFLSLDTGWRFTLLNAAAERLLGQTRDELLGRTIWEAFPDAVGNEFEAAYRAAVDSGEPRTIEAHYPAPLDAWFEVLCWPNPDGLSLYFADITERRRSADEAARLAARLALLAQTNADLLGALDVPAAIRRIPHRLVPQLAEGAIVTVLDEGGRAQDLGWWHADPALRPALDRYVAERITAMPLNSPLARVLHTAEAEYVPPRAVAELLSDPDAAARLAGLGPVWAVALPIRGRSKVLGVLTLFSPATRGRDLDGESTAQDIADRIGLALDNSRLAAAQAQLAEELQRSLLTEPPQPDHGQIVVRYLPAAEAARVGGDWYDAFIQPMGATMLVIGDVVGHDTAAAAAMGQLRSLLRGIATYSNAGPVEVLRGLDSAMEVLGMGTLATCAVARFEQTPDEVERGVTRMVWANAGHPPPLVVDPEGAVVDLGPERGELLLGVQSSAERRERTVELARGSTVILYTDGLVERRDATLDDGLDRLIAAVGDLAGAELEELCTGVLDRMVHGRPDDDVAVVAVRLHRQDRPRPLEAGPNSVPDVIPHRPEPRPATIGASDR